jgi:hypothetical protein
MYKIVSYLLESHVLSPVKPIGSEFPSVERMPENLTVNGKYIANPAEFVLEIQRLSENTLFKSYYNRHVGAITISKMPLGPNHIFNMLPCIFRNVKQAAPEVSEELFVRYSLLSLVRPDYATQTDVLTLQDYVRYCVRTNCVPPLDIRPSPKGGLGVFARKELPAGTVVGVYAGEKHDNLALRSSGKSLAYVSNSRDYHTLIDASAVGNITRFINSADWSKDQNVCSLSINIEGQSYSVYFLHFGCDAGEELLMVYPPYCKDLFSDKGYC